MTHRVPRTTWLGLLLGLVAPAAEADVPPPAEAPVSFSRQVLPVLQRNCQGCHQPAKANGKLDLTDFAAVRLGGKSGPGFEPGKPDESGLVENIIGDPPAMPPQGPKLAEAEVALIATWVRQGGGDDTPPQAKDSIDADHPPTYAAAPLVTALAFSPDGTELAVSGYREVLIHKADGTGLVRRLVGQSQRIESLAYSPDGTTLACVGGSPGRFGEVQFWDAREAKLKAAHRSTRDTLYGGSYSPEGKRFAFGCADNSARVFDVAGGKETLKIDHHSDWVFATAFSRDGKHLITLGRDGAIKLTEAATGSFIDDIGKNYGELKVMVLRPKEDQVAIGGDERVPRLYKIFRTQARDPKYTDFNLLKAMEPLAGAGPVSAIAFAPDGTTLAVGGSAAEVRLFDPATGARKAALAGHTGGIFAIAFTPDGTRVATGGFEGVVRLFETATGRPIAAFAPAPLLGLPPLARINDR